MRGRGRGEHGQAICPTLTDGELNLMIRMETLELVLFAVLQCFPIATQFVKGSTDANSFWGFGHNRSFSHQVKLLLLIVLRTLKKSDLSKKKRRRYYGVKNAVDP